ncbi:hypothetical protein OIV83_001378 [Microbotryomycetes sp. JL201]|nr:hypothetical protein OIV83_001378 [Microbotryomycetes sp. JL201]
MTQCTADEVHNVSSASLKRANPEDVQYHLYSWKLSKVSPASAAPVKSWEYASIDMRRAISTPPTFLDALKRRVPTLEDSIVSSSPFRNSRSVPSTLSSSQSLRSESDSASFPHSGHSTRMPHSSFMAFAEPLTLEPQKNSFDKHPASLTPSSHQLHSHESQIPVFRKQSFQTSSGSGVQAFESSGREVLQDITERNEAGPILRSAHSHRPKASNSSVHSTNEEPRVMIDGHRLAALPPSIQLLMHKALRYLLTNEARYKLDSDSIRTLHDSAPWFTASLTKIEHTLSGNEAHEDTP